MYKENRTNSCSLYYKVEFNINGIFLINIRHRGNYRLGEKKFLAKENLPKDFKSAVQRINFDFFRNQRYEIEQSGMCNNYLVEVRNGIIRHIYTKTSYFNYGNPGMPEEVDYNLWDRNGMEITASRFRNFSVYRAEWEDGTKLKIDEKADDKSTQLLRNEIIVPVFIGEYVKGSWEDSDSKYPDHWRFGETITILEIV